MNDKPHIDCPGTEPTSPRLDAGEKPLEIWLADICCILFAASRCFNVFLLRNRSLHASTHISTFSPVAEEVGLSMLTCTGTVCGFRSGEYSDHCD
jgi:hypothetical protein